MLPVKNKDFSIFYLTKLKLSSASFDSAHRLCKKTKFFKLLPIYAPIRIKNQIASPIYRYK